MNALTDIALTSLGGFPLVVWLGLTTIILLISTATYGYLLFKGKIRGSIIFHRNLAFTTITVGLVHATLAVSLFM